MKIFSANQIREIDSQTIAEENMESYQLMERAASVCVTWITANYRADIPFLVLCGAGNNGGDGFAIARLLQEKGYSVKAFFLRFATPSPDCLRNINELLKQQDDAVLIVEEGSYLSDIPQNAILIDAILGTGTSRPPEGWIAQFIRHINGLPNEVLAIDMPSGCGADWLPKEENAVIQAEHTLSFEVYKRSLLHPEGGKHAGQVHLIDIGLSRNAIARMQTQYETLDEITVRGIFKRRQPFSHKGTHGTALIIGGSKGMIGATVLSARAAGRAGAGKVVALIPECGYGIMQTAVPEAMCKTSGAEHLEDMRYEGADATGVGPGIEPNKETKAALESLIRQSKHPLVLDAGALNIIGEKKELLHLLPPYSILTPHPKEFERIWAQADNSMQRADSARAMAMRYNIIIVLKDRHSFIATPQGACYYNTSGNAGLATGGSGDVLTGIITGLLAGGYAPVNAALFGVWLHGAAAENCTSETGIESMVAGDIAEGLGAAFKRLEG